MVKTTYNICKVRVSNLKQKKNMNQCVKLKLMLEQNIVTVHKKEMVDNKQIKLLHQAPLKIFMFLQIQSSWIRK